MFDDVPVQVWLLIAIVVAAYAPARYVVQHIAQSPSGRDITRPAQDLAWRTSGQFSRSLTILVALVALARFIFTPTAADFAASPAFLPLLMGAGGTWALFTVLNGMTTGKVEPFVRGFDAVYERKSQPRRFWASMGWNTVLGLGCLWLG